MKKIDWNQPITWKQYATLCGVSLGVTTVYVGAYLGYLFKDQITKKVKEFTVDKVDYIHEKLHENDEPHMYHWGD